MPFTKLYVSLIYINKWRNIAENNLTNNNRVQLRQVSSQSDKKENDKKNTTFKIYVMWLILTFNLGLGLSLVVLLFQLLPSKFMNPVIWTLIVKISNPYVTTDHICTVALTEKI